MSANHASPERGLSGCGAAVVRCLHEIEGVLDRKTLHDSVQYVERQDGDERVVLHFVREIGLRPNKKQARGQVLPDRFSQTKALVFWKENDILLKNELEKEQTKQHY